jgi:hypothetical protein
MRCGDALPACAAGRAGVIFATVLFAAPAHASDQYVIFGAGGRPCGSWLQVRSQALPDSAVLQSWVLGYVTSVNANVLTVNQDVTGGANPDALFSWVDNYCAAHPLASIARAADSLVETLRTKNKAQ